MRYGGNDGNSFTVNASNLDSSKSYTIDVSTDDSNIGFDSNCTEPQEEATVQSNTSHTSSLTLYGCSHRRRNGNRDPFTRRLDGRHRYPPLNRNNSAASAYSAYSDDTDFRTRQHDGPGR